MHTAANLQAMQQEGAHQHECGAGSVGRDGGQDGREEEGDQEEEGHNHGCARVAGRVGSATVGM